MRLQFVQLCYIFSVREAPTRLLIRQGDTVLGDRVEVRLNSYSYFLYVFSVFWYIGVIPQ
jgi:hypothetical protein